MKDEKFCKISKFYKHNDTITTCAIYSIAAKRDQYIKLKEVFHDDGHSVHVCVDKMNELIEFIRMNDLLTKSGKVRLEKLFDALSNDERIQDLDSKSCYARSQYDEGFTELFVIGLRDNRPTLALNMGKINEFIDFLTDYKIKHAV